MLRILLATLLAPLLAAHATDSIDLRLPTENHHLFTGKPERFYMYVDRTFEGETSKPWQGGAYGFVRTAQRINGDVLLTKFHEGIDIAPVKRDKAGNPLDLITSIADGRVVHVSNISGRSNYGKYLVVEHLWENSPIYSLYAHLAEITCNPGDTVRTGSVLGRMGYTGAGINRTRAHLHLEIAFLSSLRFDDWQKAYGGGINHHGNFNGMNLIGCDVAGFFLAHRKNPNITFSQFIATTPVHFKVAVPALSGGTPEFLKRYPWLRKNPEAPAGKTNSWLISFSATGQPVSFEASTQAVETPVVVAVRPAKHPHRYLTRNLITGEGNRATLTPGGRALIALITDNFPAPTASNP